MAGFFSGMIIPRLLIQLIAGVSVVVAGMIAIPLTHLRGTAAGILALVVIAAAIRAGELGGDYIWKLIELRRLRRLRRRAT